MFLDGFEKVAAVPGLTGAVVGAIAGGEDDKKTGGKKNRGIGAARGVGAELGGEAGAAAGLMAGYKLSRRMNSKTRASHISKIVGGSAAGLALGAYGGYRTAKAILPKYEREKKG
jgi:hypothetical protein